SSALPSARAPRGGQVRQEELRRLMREKQRQNAGKKRIDSPFAKYPPLGHLSCALCNAPVKSELLWQTHALGKQHREVSGGRGPGGAEMAAGGPAGGVTGLCGRVQALGYRVTLFQLSSLEQNGAKERLSKSPGPSLLSGNYDDDDEEEEQEDHSNKSSVMHKTEIPPPTQEVIANSLPTGNDECSNKTTAAPIVSHSGSIQKPEIQEKVVERKENTAEALPEGFFDDPEVDAKVRKVDAPKDQMDKEWDEFQKAMRQVNTISEAIVAEEDEEGRLDRQIGEIDEQIECYRRVELLRNRQDLMKEKFKEAMRLRSTQEKEDETLGSEDEEELQDLLSQDWRVKGALL
uniref:Zinc finger protein 830 n=1 Tax=Apteryx owenii TaxID=8824 RepID=A0A8B9PFW7_APTOW